MFKIIITIFSTLFLAVNAKAQTHAMEISDITSARYSPRGAGEVTPLQGDTYTRLSADGKKIEVMSFRTGKLERVIFDVDNARGAKLESIDGYIMSPDQKNILVSTESKSIYRHSYTAVWYIYNVANNKMVKLSDGGPQQRPLWSPDGLQVGFVRDNNLFIVKLLYDNAETQVTTDGSFNGVINGIPDWVNEEEFASDCSYTFTADSKMLVWIRYDESNVETFSFPLYKGMKPELQQNRDIPGAYSYKYPKAGHDNSKISVHSFDIKSRQTRQLQIPVDADGYIPRIFPTTVADQVAVVTLNRHQDNMRLYMCNTRSTVSQLVIDEKVTPYINEATYSDLTITDKNILMQSERDGYNHLYVYSLNGKLQRQITSGNTIVTDVYGYDDATQTAYLQIVGETPAQRYVCKIDAKSKLTRLSQHTTGQAKAIFSADYRYFVETWSDVNTPTQVSACNQNGQRIALIRDNKEVSDAVSSLSKVQKEFFTFTTKDGVVLNGFMMKPANFDASRKYPVIMHQYSGPGSQEVKDSWNIGACGRGGVFEHYMCEQGFICVIVDGRGTGYRGADFEKCTYMRLGEKESHDQAEAAHYLASLPYVDGSRIGIWGWSFGGFNTLMSMSEGSGAFACGVAIAPPTSWRYYDTIYTERFMRTPQENPDGYDNVNAIARASQLQGSLLLVHGLADDNVHFQNTAEYTEALVQADKDFRQLTYTNRNHFIMGGNTRNHLYRQVINHFIQYLK